jgi:hypothetical protein
MATINEDPAAVGELRNAIRRMPDPEAGGYLAGWLAAQVYGTAERHGKRCEGCETCEDLALLLAGVTVQREHMQPDGPPPTRLTLWTYRLLRWLIKPVGSR